MQSVQVKFSLKRHTLSLIIAGLVGSSLIGLPASALELAEIALDDNPGGFVMNGIMGGDGTGYSVSSIGDMNGDGLPDVVIGAYAANDRPGGAYVVFGKADGKTLELSEVAAGNGGFVIKGINPADYAGISVSDIGDINGDRLADLIIGASGADPNGSASGQSYVVFGKSHNTNPVLLADVVNGQGGFVINGIAGGNQVGHSVSGAGDVNNDGLNDFIIGSHTRGESYVVFGGRYTTAAVNLADVAVGIGGFVIQHAGLAGYSGWSVSGAGDVNHDGYDDVIVGAYRARPDGRTDAGQSYVVFGKSGGQPVSLYVLAQGGGGGFAINGIADSDFSGISVSGAGYVNDDAYADVIIGARQADPSGNVNAGQAYVVFGKTGLDTVELSNIAAGHGGGFVINGSATNDLAGTAVSEAGDVDGDGLDDVIIGATGGTGKSYVVLGKVDRHPVELADVEMDKGGFVINGIDASDYAGVAVSSAGDMNGDGLADLLIGASAADPNGTSSGEAYVVFSPYTDIASYAMLNCLTTDTPPVYDPITQTVDLPAVDMQALNPFTGEPTGDIVVARLSLEKMPGINDFQIVPDTMKFLNYASTPNLSHARYQYHEGIFLRGATLETCVSLESVVVLPPGIQVTTVAHRYAVTLQQLAVEPDVFHIKDIKRVNR